MAAPGYDKDHDQRIRFITDEHPGREFEDAFSELTDWQPMFNLCTTDDAVIVHVELPGVEPEDIVILLKSRYLLIAGTRIMPRSITDDRCIFHNLEIPFGRFRRRIDLPVPVETRNCRHEIHEGILTLRLRAVPERFIPVEGE